MKHFSALRMAVVAAGFFLVACGNLVSTPSVVPTSTVANPPAVPTTTPVVSSLPGTAVSFDRLSLVIPDGVAASGSGTLVPEAKGENIFPWDVAPEHVQFKLDGYVLENKYQPPHIYIYPAQAYAQLMENGSAAQNIEKLQAVLAQPSMVDDKALPFVPFFNVTPALAAQVKVIPFQNGRGLRMVTQYAMGPVIINNHELFYHFQGLTEDGQYYVIAILPITAPGLPEDGQPGSVAPQGGISVPDLNDMNANWMGYYGDIRQMLQGLEPGAYNPDLDQLDALIGSLRIASE